MSGARCAAIASDGSDLQKNEVEDEDRQGGGEVEDRTVERVLDADKEGYPVLQQMFNEATIGSLYFLSCRQAMLVLKDLKESGASFADGAQVAVIPFHIAYDNVVADPIETEDRDEKGRIVSIIFRFVPDFSELGEAKRMLEEQGQSLDSIPEVPVFFKDVKNAEAKTLFISHQDCDGYFEEGFAELPRLLGDLSTFLESGERVTVIPSTENMEYVNSIFDKAGFNQ
eukprot:CAMPEP_0198724520 /NCGR_PEP_ID=MMETSP1475-20131203/1975_1 /TAXON_ID= ORGANISM="Unidentified sp., Strain CCMP1999" /NCGR_SAMPLE_ID=MMETSP1475 /ASSEMBLY_ACC=CAM_ASM_001111 /LENGTH=226 /DNA_ID=CAMNT_0044486069 /DNA_START=129 /DNA_END=810 /DNA_ORIENTATION=-